MTLYEYLKMAENDFDTYDTEYDAEVTVCYIDNEDDEYDKFCNEIIKKVEVIKINDFNLVVNWCELIKRNIDKFKEFSNQRNIGRNSGIKIIFFRSVVPAHEIITVLNRVCRHSHLFPVHYVHRIVRAVHAKRYLTGRNIGNAVKNNMRIFRLR